MRSATTTISSDISRVVPAGNRLAWRTHIDAHPLNDFCQAGLHQPFAFHFNETLVAVSDHAKRRSWRIADYRSSKIKDAATQKRRRQSVAPVCHDLATLKTESHRIAEVSSLLKHQNARTQNTGKPTESHHPAPTGRHPLHVPPRE